LWIEPHLQNRLGIKGCNNRSTIDSAFPNPLSNDFARSNGIRFSPQLQEPPDEKRREDYKYRTMVHKLIAGDVTAF
jgi:hypothetical protein